MTRIAMHETPSAPNQVGHMRSPSRSRRRRRLAGLRPGTPPGSLTAPAAPTAPVRLSVMSYDAASAAEPAARDVDEAIRLIRPGGVTWIDVEGLGDPTVLARLGERFGLHPLALEDALNVPQRPKV